MLRELSCSKIKGRGARAPGREAGQGCAGERLPQFPGTLRRLRGSERGKTGCFPAAAAAERADSRGRPDAPIGPRRANQRPQLALQRGRGLNSGAAAETPGRAWPRVQSRPRPVGGTALAARLPRAHTPRALEPTFEKCPFERKRPPPSPLRRARLGEVFVSFFQIILATLTV